MIKIDITAGFPYKRAIWKESVTVHIKTVYCIVELERIGEPGFTGLANTVEILSRRGNTYALAELIFQV